MAAETLPYIYRWDRQGRKGQPCAMTARGAMNSCRVEFADGYRMITSRNALRKAAETRSRIPADYTQSRIAALAKED